MSETTAPTPALVPLRTQANSPTLIIGPTGTGKSALLKTLVEYVWETYQMITLVYHTDGGGWPAPLEAVRRRGLCWIWKMRTRDYANRATLSFETCYLASKGWWPAKINLQTGETTPGVAMIPPTTDIYTLTCPDGHLIREVYSQAHIVPGICPTCKKMIQIEQMSVKGNVRITKGLEKVGARCYDGLSSFNAWWLQDMGGRAGRKELEGEKAALGGVLESGQLAFGGNNRAQIGFAQTRTEEVVNNALSIPGMVVPPIFTALTNESVDEGGLTVVGPKFAGNAKTDEGPTWVGNCLETAKALNADGKEVYRLYLSEYFDSGNRRHLCKHRGGPTMPSFLEDPPIDPADPERGCFTGFSLALFFTLLEQSVQDAEKASAEKYPDAPGLPEGETSFGDSGQVALGAAAPGAPVSRPRSRKVGKVGGNTGAAPPVAPAETAGPPVAEAPVPPPVATSPVSTPPAATEAPAVSPGATPPTQTGWAQPPGARRAPRQRTVAAGVSDPAAPPTAAAQPAPPPVPPPTEPAQAALPVETPAPTPPVTTGPSRGPRPRPGVVRPAANPASAPTPPAQAPGRTAHKW